MLNGMYSIIPSFSTGVSITASQADVESLHRAEVWTLLHQEGSGVWEVEPHSIKQSAKERMNSW